MVQIKCDKCGEEFAITREKCPYCGDKVKTSCTFYCGDCGSEINIKEQICKTCNKKPEEIIIKQSNGSEVRTSFDTEDSYVEQKVEEEPTNEVVENTPEKNMIQEILKKDMLLLLVLQLIVLVFLIILEGIKFKFIYSCVFAVLLFWGYREAKNGKEIAGTVGIIIAILMMLTILGADVVDFALGFFLLLHSIRYTKQFIKKD